MLYAIDKNGNKIKPEPKEKAKCPFCKGTVIACTGEIKNWYWRHEIVVKSDCLASTYENEGIWHSNWKYLFDKELVEVYCERGNEKMIADVKLENELVIEIQHSPISSKTIKGRESFHRKMIWIFDASGPVESGRLRYENNWYHWVQPRLSIIKCQCPVFLDLGFGNLFEVHEIITEKIRGEEWEEWTKTVFKGKGKIYTREEFKEKMMLTDKEIRKSPFLDSFRKDYFEPRNKHSSDPKTKEKDDEEKQLSLF